MDRQILLKVETNFCKKGKIQNIELLVMIGCLELFVLNVDF